MNTEEELDKLIKKIAELEKTIKEIENYAGSDIPGMTLKDRFKELKLR